MSSVASLLSSSAGLSYLTPIRSGRAILGVGPQAGIVVDTNLTADSIVVVSFDTVAGSPILNTGYAVSIAPGDDFKVTLTAPTNPVPAGNAFFNWAILKY